MGSDEHRLRHGQHLRQSGRQRARGLHRDRGRCPDEVAGGFSSLGPDCSTFRGTAVTFKALSGVTYELLLEGRPTFPEEATPGEGSFALKLAATPVPPNDDFAGATVLNGQTLENGVYAAGASGFSWNASKEPGEPEHAGDSGGASVWYSWTAPSTGDFRVSSCGRFATVLLGIYTGGSVDALTQVVSRRDCGISMLPAVAGVTYHIAVDGEFDSGSGSAAVGALGVNVSRVPPSPTPAAYESIVEREFQFQVSPPRTMIRKRSLKPAKGRATFAFSSSEPDSTFRCRIDRKPFGRCASPKAYRGLEPGRHVFEVVAVGAAGNRDPTPAVARFSIPTHRRGKR